MNTNDTIEPDQSVIRVPFWLVALVSAALLVISVGIYWLAAGSLAP